MQNTILLQTYVVSEDIFSVPSSTYMKMDSAVQLSVWGDSDTEFHYDHFCLSFAHLIWLGSWSYSPLGPSYAPQECFSSSAAYKQKGFPAAVLPIVFQSESGSPTGHCVISSDTHVIAGIGTDVPVAYNRQLAAPCTPYWSDTYRRLHK